MKKKKRENREAGKRLGSTSLPGSEILTASQVKAILNQKDGFTAKDRRELSQQENSKNARKKKHVHNPATNGDEADDEEEEQPQTQTPRPGSGKENFFFARLGEALDAHFCVFLR